MHKDTIKKAVALKYGEEDDAPKILATARGYLANKIIQTAKRFNVPLIYSSEAVDKLVYLDPGQEIPPELYEVVAKIYAFLAKIDADMESGKNE